MRPADDHQHRRAKPRSCTLMGSAWLTVEIRSSMDGRRLERFLRGWVAVMAASKPRAARWWCARPAWPRPAPAGLVRSQGDRWPQCSECITRLRPLTSPTARQDETEGGRDADERSGRRQDRRRVRKSLAAEPGRSDRGGAPRRSFAPPRPLGGRAHQRPLAICRRREHHSSGDPNQVIAGEIRRPA